MADFIRESLRTKSLTARHVFRLNHREIRAFGRFAATPDERAARIQAACRDRQFWYRLPFAETACAALRTLDGSMPLDALSMVAKAIEACKRQAFPLTTGQLKAMSTVRRANMFNTRK